MSERLWLHIVGELETEWPGERKREILRDLA
jgi:hypothetical protein